MKTQHYHQKVLGFYNIDNKVIIYNRIRPEELVIIDLLLGREIDDIDENLLEYLNNPSIEMPNPPPREIRNAIDIVLRPVSFKIINVTAAGGIWDAVKEGIKKSDIGQRFDKTSERNKLKQLLYERKDHYKVLKEFADQSKDLINDLDLKISNHLIPADSPEILNHLLEKNPKWAGLLKIDDLDSDELLVFKGFLNTRGELIGTTGENLITKIRIEPRKVSWSNQKLVKELCEAIKKAINSDSFKVRVVGPPSDERKIEISTQNIGVKISLADILQIKAEHVSKRETKYVPECAWEDTFNNSTELLTRYFSEDLLSNDNSKLIEMFFDFCIKTIGINQGKISKKCLDIVFIEPKGKHLVMVADPNTITQIDDYFDNEKNPKIGAVAGKKPAEKKPDFVDEKGNKFTLKKENQQKTKKILDI